MRASAKKLKFRRLHYAVKSRWVGVASLIGPGLRRSGQRNAVVARRS